MKQTPLPEALRSVPSEVLENYVGSQIAMFANGLAHRLGQYGYHVPTDVYKESAREVFQLLISEPSPRLPTQRAPDMQLVFRHDCLALGCLLQSCQLCKHNPSRRCAVNFDKKYLVNDVLKAKCQAVIRVEIVERNTNMPVDTSELRENMVLQMAILDGNTYDAKFEAGLENDFESCLLLTNNKGSPTLVGMAVTNDQRGFIRVPLISSRAVLPDLRVTDSSEAMLSGRKPPLRLMMRAVYKDSGAPVPHIRHAISEGFVVATRRTRTAGKVEIPSVDDHVSKLEHMGRETVKKLADIKDAATVAGIDDLKLPETMLGSSCIETVGMFQQLALHAEHDAHLQKRLQQVLKLNKEKWEEAREHAMKAVVVDNRMRVWWASPPSGAAPRVGMVFSCTKGTVDLETPIALVQDGAHIRFAADWSQNQHDLVRQLQPVALSQWWQPNHLHWDLLEWDSETYKNSGQLVKAQIDADTPSAMTMGQAPRLSAQMPQVAGAMAAPTGEPARLSAQPRPLPSSAMASLLSASQAAGGLDTGRLQARAPGDLHGGGDPAPQAAGLGSGAGPSATRAVPLSQLRSEDMLSDILPSSNPYNTAALQELAGGPGSRLMSGMSIEGMLPEGNAGMPLTISRNTSGLDTMQSIEQALPDGETAGAAAPQAGAPPTSQP